LHLSFADILKNIYNLETHENLFKKKEIEKRKFYTNLNGKKNPVVKKIKLSTRSPLYMKTQFKYFPLTSKHKIKQLEANSYLNALS